MVVQEFISNYKEAFGITAELPIAFWYSEIPCGINEKINGCFFKDMSQVRDGISISLSLDTVTCGGGKFYSGFTEMPDRIPNFVSLKEKYKKTPEMVLEYIDDLGVTLSDKPYLNFVRIDKLDSFDDIEGLLFYATPDILSGLLTWTFFDTNAPDAVTTQFGSGCSVIVTQTVEENRKNGNRTFLGGFDPSVRPHFGANELSYTIPLSRFKVMYKTMQESCLFDTHAWAKIRERINDQTIS